MIGPNIYKLTLLSDTASYKAGALYIGKSVGTSSYWAGGVIPNRIAKKYGKGVFKKEIVVKGNFNKLLLCELEKHYIRLYKSQVSFGGLNIKTGGYDGSIDKEVFQYDKEGHYVNTYKNATLAAQAFNTSSKRVAKCCSQEKCQVGGFQWRYYKRDQIRALGGPTGKVVYQYDMYGNYLRDFRSLREASKITGLCVSGIINALKKRCKTNGGFQWSYHKLTEIPPAYRKCSIHKYLKTGEYVESFFYLEDFFKKCNNRPSMYFLKTVIDKENMSAKGFQWRSYRVDNCGVYLDKRVHKV